MKLFLDTADIKQIQQFIPTGLIDGVTTNPTHLAKEGQDPKGVITRICQLLPSGQISVEVTEQDAQQVYKQAHKIAALGPNIMVKIPCYSDYYAVINKLVQEGVSLNITLVFSLVQAAFMCKLGVAYISPFIGRWDDIDVEGKDVLFEIRAMIDEYGFDTKLLAASVRGVRHMHEAILAGADALTVPVDVLQKAMSHSLTLEGMKKFNAHWTTLGIKQFP